VTAGADRLERTRLAILEHVHRKEQRKHKAPEVAPQPVFESDLEGAPPTARSRVRKGGPAGWLGHARDMVDDWWRYHPAHMAGDLARPALASYASRKPVQYLAIAAGAGVLLLLLRPWKLISATGVLVAVAKSPQVASLVMSAMATSHNPRDDEPIDE
jgi:hypothetical protein